MRGGNARIGAGHLENRNQESKRGSVGDQKRVTALDGEKLYLVRRYV